MRKAASELGYSNSFPRWFRYTVFRQVALALLLMQLIRVIWTLANRNLFAEASPFEILSAVFWGSFFDLPVLAYFFLPLWIWMLVFPGGNQRKPAITRALFTLCSSPVLLLNAIDTGYSQVTGRRSGPELFSTLSDPANPVSAYLLEYWWASLLIVAALAIIWKTAPVGGHSLYIYRPGRWVGNLLRTVTAAGIWLICARGGFHLKPMTPLHAGLYVPAELIGVTASTPLHVISIKKGDDLPDVRMMPQEEAFRLAKPVFEYRRKDQNGQRPNVIMIIVESLGRDYTGFLNNKPYTPFLDTFSRRCLNFRYCYANGTRSIEMVPSIFCGMPGLIESHYLNSSYATNKIENGFSVFSRDGYSCSFFHGAANGTMSFQSFLGQTGLQQYFGLDQYPKDSLKLHHDGSWGVFDEYYLRYFLRCCDTMRKPFFNAVFTLSSHHPYKVPDKYVDLFKKGKLPIHKSIRYTDYCLKQFFSEVRKYPWFENTIFVITGDHTSYGEEDYFYSESGHFEIPLLFYGAGIEAGINDKTVSQCDLVPTLMAMCGVNGKFFGFGRNMLDSNYGGYSMHKEKGLYYIIRYPYALGIDHTGKVKDFHTQPRNNKRPKHLPHSGPVYEELHDLMRAYLQVFSVAVRNNRWQAAGTGNP